MSKWQYQEVFFDSFLEFLTSLNSLGELGWELIYIEQTDADTRAEFRSQQNQGDDKWVAIFKRPAEE